MKLKWKIFRTANIVEIILVTVIVSITVYSSNLSFTNDYDFLAFLMVIVLSASIIANGFNNINLINYLENGNKLSNRKKVWFWMLFGIVLIAVLLIGIGLVALYLSYRRQVTDHAEAPGEMIAVIWGITIAINACLILYLQVVLFYKIRKHAHETESLLVNTIGIIDEV